MIQHETLPLHLQVCDELHQLALEDNRQLKEHGRMPAPALLERKRALLARLEQNLTALRSMPTAGPAQRQLVEKLRDRILQILQLDKENEQLLLRASLNRGVAPAAARAPAPALLQKIYSASPRESALTPRPAS